MSFIPVLLGLLGVLVLQIGIVIQKSGVHTFYSVNYPILSKAGFSKFIIDRSTVNWVTGTAITFLGAILGYFAISISAISLIQPLIALGPLALGAIVVLFFKESQVLTKRFWTATIMSGIGVLVLAMNNNVGAANHSFDENNLLLTMMLLSSLVLFAGFILFRLQIFKPGVPEAVLGGLLGGLPPIFAKISVAGTGESLLTSYWSIGALLLTQFLSFYFLQRAIHSGSFAAVSSIFQAFAISFPVLLAALWLGEFVGGFQIAGILLILLSAVILSRADFLRNLGLSSSFEIRPVSEATRGENFVSSDIPTPVAEN